ncbi:MAG: hypothetical protein Q8868_12190 [Bacteroidota bacterium]|nr:hypothetical protein [Bacteroidota bacterium]
MSNIAFEIIRFTTELGSGISPQRIYNTPSGQLIIPVEAGICCLGPNGETLEILFPVTSIANVINLAGSGPPAWGLIMALPSSYLWYMDLLRNTSTIGYINTNNPVENRIKADAYAKSALKKSGSLYIESLSQELKYQKLLLTSLEVELSFAESQLQQSSSAVNAYTVNHIRSMINAQNAAISAAELKKASAQEEFAHTN